ncbi:MAG: DUF1553 domain-containing protein [Planctomycetaceae bacterium]
MLWILIAVPVYAAEPDYLRQIKPLLKDRCYACHGGLKQQAQLRVDTVSGLRAGGESGAAVVPGDSASSLLLKAIRGDDGFSKMPPDGEAVPLTAEQIQLISDWIQSGAPGPEQEQPEADPRDHWAFRRPVRPALPVTSLVSDNPLDQFIAAKWAASNLRPAKAAPPEVLLRRVHLDLIGLPPTREELQHFLADPSEAAYLRVVEQLLDDPRHGERWARHWMDVWRYADWYGRRNVPDWWNSACQIWRWRDWIVMSLNADRGYDEMIQEMLAGDEIAGDRDDRAVATGFLARNWYALNYNSWMRENIEHTAKAFLGLTFNCAHCHDHKYDPITQVDYFRFRAFFEPLEMRQDRWRDEPDPGPFQKYDYLTLRKVVPYGAIRVFDERPDAPTYLYTGGDERNKLKDRPPIAPGIPAFLDDGEFRVEPVSLPIAAWYPGSKAFIREAETAACRQAIQSAESALHAQRSSVQPVVAKISELIQQLESQQAGLQRELEAMKSALGPEVVSARLTVVEWELKSKQRRRDETRLPLLAAEQQLAAARLQNIALKARMAADDVRYLGQPGDPEELSLAAAIAERSAKHAVAQATLTQAEAELFSAQRAGQANAIKQAEQKLAAAKTAREAAAATLTKTDAAYSSISPVYPAHSTGRRSALARWIASRNNPLTARVAVNHVWLRHFGTALVDSVFDYGRNGKPPTHPELLDWLAVEFMESGWSQKHLHRLIVTSRVYRQSSATTGEAYAHNQDIDPDNRDYWRFGARRLEAEVIRDSLLFTANRLDTTLGGKELEVDLDGKTARRSLYYSSHPEDGGRLAVLENFDVPDTCDCYRRSESIRPQQALALTNSAFTRTLSVQLAQQLSNQRPADERSRATLIGAAFEQILSRGPTAAERVVAETFWTEFAESLVSAGGDQAGADTAALESLVHSLFNHHEFVTIR